MFQTEAEIALKSFEYLVSRRNQLLDKIRFGFFALNGGSLLGLMALLGGDGEAAAWLGFNPPMARNAAIAFAIGAILSGLSIFSDANLYRREAGAASARQLVTARLWALYEAEFTEENYKKVGAAMQEFHELPLVDFQFSILSIALLNFAAGAWLFGVLLPLFRVFSL